MNHRIIALFDRLRGLAVRLVIPANAATLPYYIMEITQVSEFIRAVEKYYAFIRVRSAERAGQTGF